MYDHLWATQEDAATILMAKRTIHKNT